VPTFAQCKDQLCRNLQTILYAAVTDFREFRPSRTATPDMSIKGTKVPCQMTAWANNVSMYICYAQVPYENAGSWYINVLEDLKILQPSWHFDVTSPVADHFVEAGPPDCEVPATDGPYVGHCPLHLQITKQTDGTAKIYLWMSSLSSPYLMKRPPPPSNAAATAATPGVVGNGCDDLCQNLKKIFEALSNAFVDLRSAKASSEMSDATVKLAGAGNCLVAVASKSNSNQVGAQYVCYWPEGSASAADEQFRDLSSRLQILMPSNWAVHQEDQSEELTGAKVTVWCAVAPDSKQEACLYMTHESVGLHIRAFN
jgi:hypothetical protein